MAEQRKIRKGRDWTFIVYPESAPVDWRDILDDTHVRWIESPLHNKDVNPDGTLKKPHWHIMMSWDGPVASGPVRLVSEAVGSYVDVKKVGSARGLVRYMVHMDNPEKYQYDVSEIKGHNGADVQSYFELTATDRLSVMKEIVQFIYDNEITNYATFLMLAITEQDNDDWFSVAVNSNTLAINKMIDAMWQKKYRDRKYDVDTGKIQK
jgi:Plasmid replication protein.